MDSLSPLSNAPPVVEAHHARSRPATRTRRLAVALLLGGGIAGLMWRQLSTAEQPVATPAAAGSVSTPPPVNASVSATAPAAVATQPPADDPRLRTPDPAVSALSDAERTRMLLGTWTTQHHGRQQIINRDDGTASLTIEFDWLAALLYGGRMQLELNWRIEQGVLTNVIASGEPAANVDRLTADFGRACRYRMLELSADRLLLQEIDDPAAFHEWTRVTAP